MEIGSIMGVSHMREGFNCEKNKENSWNVATVDDDFTYMSDAVTCGKYS